MGFDIALHVFVYSILVTEFDDLIMKALTDDLPAFGRPPGPSPTDAQWHDLYDRLADFYERYDTLANPIGIVRHIGKGKCFLPPDAPVPHQGSRLLNHTRIVNDGVTASGAHYGTDEAVLAHGMDKLQTVKTRVAAVLALARAGQAHGAIRLLSSSVAHAFDYEIRVTPPDLIQPVLALLDDVLRDALLDILATIKGHGVPDSSSARIDNAMSLASLATKIGGLGLTMPSTKAPISYLCSVLHTKHDPILGQLECQKGLSRFVDQAYQTLLSQLGANGLSHLQSVTAVLPRTASSMTSLLYSSSNNIFKNNKLKTQKVVMRLIQLKVRKRRQDTHPRHADGNDLTMEDAVYTHIVTSRSQVSRVMHSTLWFRSNRCLHDPFVHFMRMHLGLLPLMRPWCRPSTHNDESFNVCGACNDLDYRMTSRGMHLVQCKCTYHDRYLAHELVNGVYNLFAKGLELLPLSTPPLMP